MADSVPALVWNTVEQIRAASTFVGVEAGQDGAEQLRPRLDTQQAVPLAFDFILAGEQALIFPVLVFAQRHQILTQSFRSCASR